ncbi:Phytochrome-like protein cph1 [Tepidimonas thermarum]|uniref:histidine kinase n=1 Tax=Tepidimonas thermarum TaxID=335431 RepID=A0A554X2G1_9BURK|nr:ATP-binding protein [Tepidimonas thermarum]TSE30029.1 Phytochrome-like protein cph1 [Tepidimonas thermarum]
MQPPPRDPWPEHLPPSFFAALAGDAAEPPPDDAAPVAEDDALRLLRALPDGVLSLDATLRCRHANPAIQALLRPHLTWDQIDGLPWHEAVDDDWIDTLLPWVAPALRGEPGRIAVERNRDGSATHWELVLLPDRCGDTVVGLFVLLRDDTDRQRQQAALREQQQDLQQRLQRQDTHLALQQARWQALTAGLRDAAIFFLDPHGAIQDWPASAERLLGYAAQDVLGTTGPDAPQRPYPLPPDTAQALERAGLLGQSESTGWLRRADGSRLWAHMVYATLNGPDGEALGTACLVRDMTELRRLEELLRELNQALERKVEERTRQLQALNQDLEAFSYSVSHDLRAPLRHINAYVQLLREDLGEPLSPDVAEDLRTIEGAATHMGQLIEGLLAFARLGRADLNRQPVDMLDLLRSSLNRVRHDPALRRPDGACEVQLPAALPAVEGDPLLLSQVWDNLLGNAFKYSRPRQPAVIAIGGEVRPGPDGAPEAVFWVRDNGVGFDSTRATGLFGVFQRLHRAQDFEGTGIGLALCRRIVERHGGRIWADSRPGAGATFAFALPLPRNASAASEPPLDTAPTA